MKKNSMIFPIISLTTAFLIAILAPLNAYAAQHGFFYRGQCGQGVTTDYLPAPTPADAIDVRSGQVLRAITPAGTATTNPRTISAGLVLQMVGAQPARNGVGFQSLVFRADTGTVSTDDVFAVLRFNSGPSVAIPLSATEGNPGPAPGFRTFTILGASIIGLGTRTVTQVELLLRSSTASGTASQTVQFGNVILNQAGQTGLNSRVFTTVKGTCGSVPNILPPGPPV